MNRRTLYTLLALVIIIPVGFLTKFYSGPAANWVSNSLAGVLYEIFWCLVLFLLFKRLRPAYIGLLVFFTTCILELTQLWKPYFLEVLRDNFIIRTVVGNSFSWNDFPYYSIGSLLGYILIKIIIRISKV